MALSSLDRYQISTTNLAGTVAFYREVLGLIQGDRTALGVPGASMYINGHAVIHINGAGEGAKKELRGAINHVAFEADNFEAISQRLKEWGVEVVDSRAERPLGQIYLFDPSSVRIELGF